MKAVCLILLLLVIQSAHAQPGKSAYYLHQAEQFIEQEKYKSAETYADSALSLALKAKSLDTIALALHTRFEIRVARKNYANAIDDLKTERLFRDSIAAMRLKAVEGELGNALLREKDERETESQTMREEIKRLEDNAVASERNSIVILVATVALSAIIIFTFYRRKRQVAEDLVEAKGKVRDLQSFKEKLFAVLSYDLKNSVTSFENLSKSMSGQINHMGKEETLQLMTNLHTGAGNLKDALDNLIRWVAFEAKSTVFKPSTFDVKALVEQVHSNYSSQIAEKNLAINLFIPENQHVFADREMVETILNNLLSNAVHFTPQNGTITCFSGKKDGLVTLGYKDSGIGIAESDIPKLFAMAEDFHTIGKPSHKGVGVGLILSKELVERNGGRMYVESTLGQGSTFYFTLPER